MALWCLSQGNLTQGNGREGPLTDKWGPGWVVDRNGRQDTNNRMKKRPDKTWAGQRQGSAGWTWPWWSGDFHPLPTLLKSDLSEVKSHFLETSGRGSSTIMEEARKDPRLEPATWIWDFWPLEQVLLFEACCCSPRKCVPGPCLALLAQDMVDFRGWSCLLWKLAAGKAQPAQCYCQGGGQAAPWPAMPRSFTTLSLEAAPSPTQCAHVWIWSWSLTWTSTGSSVWASSVSRSSMVMITCPLR